MGLLLFILGVSLLFLLVTIYIRVFVTAGQVGENAVARRLRRLRPKDYFVINDVLLHRKNDRTTQIDHVVVSPYGIFVIETKNISGYIYGSEYGKKWVRHWKGYQRSGHYGEDTLEFDNPVLQNGAHVKALYEVLQKYNVRLIPIIAFSPEAVLKVNVQSVAVIYWPQIIKEIKKYTDQYISVEQAEVIYYFLLALNIKDKESRKRHVIDAQNNKTAYQQLYNNQ